MLHRRPPDPERPPVLMVPPLATASGSSPQSGACEGDDAAGKDTLTLRLKQIFQEIPREPFTNIIESPPSSPRAHSKKVTIDHMEFQTVLFLSHNDQLQHYGANEGVVARGDLSEDVYFIFRGIVSLLDERGQVICAIHEGSFFGEHSYFYECPRIAHVTTTTPCEIFKLDLDFLTLMQRQFPIVYQRLRTVAMSRHTVFIENGMLTGMLGEAVEPMTTTKVQPSSKEKGPEPTDGTMQQA